MRTFFVTYKYYLLGLLAIGAFFVYGEYSICIDKGIIKALKSNMFFDFIIISVIIVSGLHAIKNKTIQFSSNYSFEEFKNFISKIGEIISVPIPFIGTLAIVKLWLLSILESSNHLSDLNTGETTAMILVAGYFLVKSGIELLVQFKELRGKVSRPKPIDEEGKGLRI